MRCSFLSSGRWKVAAGMGLALAALGGSAAQAGPVQIVSQEREIRAGARVGVSTGEDGGTVEDVRSERKTAPDAGPFDAAASANASREGFVARSSATMNSTLDDGGFGFAGRLEWEVENQGLNPTEAVAEASFDVTVIFALDEAYRYEFVTELDVVRSEGGGPDGEDVNFSLARETEGGGETVDDPSGALAPGRYRLDLLRYVANSGADAPFEGVFAEEYDIRLDLEQADGGGGGEPNPIPLPPAAWSGLALMGAGLLNRWRKSTRA